MPPVVRYGYFLESPIVLLITAVVTVVLVIMTLIGSLEVDGIGDGKSNGSDLNSDGDCDVMGTGRNVDMCEICVQFNGLVHNLLLEMIFIFHCFIVL